MPIAATFRRIGPFMHEDIPQVANLRRREFGTAERFSPELLDAYRAWFTEVYLESPWRGGTVESLVYQEDNGRITGFLGLVPRPWRLNGDTLQAAISSNSVVDVGRRGLVGLMLMKAALEGPQHVSFADESNTTSRAMWGRHGGATAALYSMRWLYPLRPCRLGLLPPTAGTMLAPVARPSDAGLARVTANPFHPPKSRLCGQHPDSDTLAACLWEAAGHESIHADNDGGSLSWLLERAHRLERNGQSQAVAVRTKTENIGCYIYYLNRDGVSEVVLLYAKPAFEQDVLDHLLYHAWKLGASGLCGRMEPRMMQAILRPTLSIPLRSSMDVGSLSKTRPITRPGRGRCMFVTIGRGMVSPLSVDYTAGTAAGIEVEHIRDDAGFRELEPCWNALLRQSSSNCVFLTWEWLYLWYKHLCRGRDLDILRLSSKKDTLALVPLTIRPRRVARLLGAGAAEFLAAGPAGSDYLDCIVHSGNENQVLGALGKFAEDSRLILRLSQVRQDDSMASRWAAQMENQGWHSFSARTNVCPFIRLSGHSWQSYLKSLGPEHRYNVRRKTRNLERRFDVRFELAATETERREALSRLIELHNLRWRERSKAFNTARLVTFHEEFTRLALARGWLRLHVLRLNGNPAALLYGLRYNDVFYFYQSGFDAAYAKHSVGLVTMALAIKAAIEEGVQEYDLLHGNEQYKFHWANGVREIGQVNLSPWGVAGTMYHKVGRLTFAVKSLRRRMLTGLAADAAAIRIR